MQLFRCQKCDIEFEWVIGCKVAYDGILCKECKEKETAEFIERQKTEKDNDKIFVHNFKPFYDQSLGVYVSSYSEKKELEKKNGIEYMSNDERISATKEAKAKVEREKKYHIKKEVRNIYENVDRGHSYINDLKRKGLC